MVAAGRQHGEDGNLDETEMSVNAAHDLVVADEDRNGSPGPWEFAARFPILGYPGQGATLAAARLGPRRVRPGEPHHMNTDDLRTVWAPRVLSILRIVAALIFFEHGSQKLLGFPPTDN